MKNIKIKIFLTLFYSSSSLFFSSYKAAALPEKNNLSYNNTNFSNAKWKYQLRDFELTVKAEIDYIDNTIILLKNPEYSCKLENGGLILYDTHTNELIERFTCAKTIRGDEPKIFRQGILYDLEKTKIYYTCLVHIMDKLREKNTSSNQLLKLEYELEKICIYFCQNFYRDLSLHIQDNINTITKNKNIHCPKIEYFDLNPEEVKYKNEYGNEITEKLSEDGKKLGYILSYYKAILHNEISTNTLPCTISLSPEIHPKIVKSHNMNIEMLQFIDATREQLDIRSDNWILPLHSWSTGEDVTKHYKKLNTKLMEKNYLLCQEKNNPKIKKTKTIQFAKEPLKLQSEAQINQWGSKLISSILQSDQKRLNRKINCLKKEKQERKKLGFRKRIKDLGLFQITIN